MSEFGDTRPAPAGLIRRVAVAALQGIGGVLLVAGFSLALGSPHTALEGAAAQIASVGASFALGDVAAFAVWAAGTGGSRFAGTFSRRTVLGRVAVAAAALGLGLAAAAVVSSMVGGGPDVVRVLTGLAEVATVASAGAGSWLLLPTRSRALPPQPTVG